MRAMIASLREDTSDLFGRIFDGAQKDWRPAVRKLILNQFPQLEQGQRIELELPLGLFKVKPSAEFQLKGRRIVITGEVKVDAEVNIPFLDIGASIEEIGVRDVTPVPSDPPREEIRSAGT